MTDSEDADIEWIVNPYHAFRAARLRAYRLTQLSFLCLAVASFAILGVQGSRLSVPETDAFVVAGFLSIPAIGMLVPLAFPKYSSARVYASPLRVGLSEVGIHIDYGPRGAADLAAVDWARPLIHWDEVSAISTPELLWGRPNEIEASRKDTGTAPWRVVEISPALVSRILEAWKSRNSRLG